MNRAEIDVSNRGANPFEEEFSRISQVVENAWANGGADIALPDLDPDAALSARFLANNILPRNGTRILSGSGSKLALETRAPELSDFEVLPITELKDRDSARPLFLLDASTIDQPNVGGPKGILPDVVLDTHVGQKPDAKSVALLSDQHVATGSIVTEFAKFKNGEGAFWDSESTKKDAAGMRFGIHTDSGESNYGTARDRCAIEFLSKHSDERVWGRLTETAFFLKVQSLYERGSRIYEVKEGLFHVSFRKEELNGCRDYLGAVADRLLHHINGISVLATGEIPRGEQTVFCAALRLNRNHAAFKVFEARDVLSALKAFGGGFGSQVNGQVWGGSAVTEAPRVVEGMLLQAYFEQGRRVHRRLAALEFGE